MTRLSTTQFYQQYFVATQDICSNGLICLTVEQKLEMLENLMQWDLNAETEECHDLPTQV